MEYKTIAILGTGAVGCYVLWGLTNKNMDVCVIAKGERKQRYEANGFIINDQHYTPVIKTPEEAKGVDLLIVATKYNALRKALEDIQEICDEHTVVMSLMNGVDSEEIISEVIDESQIIYSLIKVASRRVENKVYFDAPTTIGMIYGEKDHRGNERTDALNNLFEGTGLNYRATDVIIEEIWSKFRLNVSMNLPQAMIGCDVGAYLDSEHVAFLRDALKEEVNSIAKAKGIDLGLSDDTSLIGSKVPKTARYSTLQDLDACRHTEIDMFSGTVVRLGKELGVSTPYNECTYHIIKALEEKNDGVFNYSK